MTFQQAIDRFVKDKRRYRGFAPTSEVGYRRTLSLLAEQVGDAHPSVVDRRDCMVVLERWHGETLRTNRAQMISFFRWAMGEGICETNPAEQTPQVRRRSNPRYRLNYAEMEAMLDAPWTRCWSGAASDSGYSAGSAVRSCEGCRASISAEMG